MLQSLQGLSLLSHGSSEKQAWSSPTQAFYKEKWHFIQKYENTNNQTDNSASKLSPVEAKQDTPEDCSCVGDHGGRA